jgi:hypothetical protein
MTIRDDATADALPAAMSACLHLSDVGDARVSDHGAFAAMCLGDRHASVAVFASSADAARDVADTATVWADLTEARERGEDVELWGGWVLPSDMFRGAR